MKDKQENEHERSFLGFSTDKFTEVDIKEVVNNEAAIKMLMHYYKQLVDDNKTLKNDVNTYKTYADAYEKKTSNSSTSSFLFLASNISVGFGINILTENQQTNAGWFLLATGVLFAIGATYFSFWKN